MYFFYWSSSEKSYSAIQITSKIINDKGLYDILISSNKIVHPRQILNRNDSDPIIADDLR